MKKASYTDSLRAQEALFLIEHNPLEAKVKFEKYLKDYPLHHFAHVQYASLLVKLGEFEKALEILDKVEKTYTQHDYSSEYIEAMIIDIVDARLKALCFLGRYDEFFRYYHANESKTIKERIHSALFYCNRHVHNTVKFKREGRGYLFRQIIEYQKSDFLEHIKAHKANSYNTLRGNEKSVFMPDFPLDIALKEIEKAIPKSRNTCFDFFADVYYFKYDNCGFGEDGKLADYIKVVCLHNTENIVTVYPTNEYKESLYTDLSYISPNKKSNNYVTQMKNTTIAPGDIVIANNEKYIVRKIISDKEISLLKIVENGEVNFMYKNSNYSVLKNAVVLDPKNVTIHQKLNSDILKSFEKAKKSKPKTKFIYYKEGDVLSLNNTSFLVIDAEDSDYMIAVDQSNNYVCLTKNEQYKINYSMSKFEVSCITSDLDYDESKKRTLINEFKSSNQR